MLRWIVAGAYAAITVQEFITSRRVFHDVAEQHGAPRRLSVGDVAIVVGMALAWPLIKGVGLVVRLNLWKKGRQI